VNAFVTDGDQRAALAITRSLGRRGIRVLVGDERPRCLASSSRHCARHVTYPSPAAEPGAFRAFLADFVQRERVDVVFPVGDVTTSLAGLSQDVLRRHTTLAAADFAAFDQVTDKVALVQSARACGVPVPRTHVVEGAAALPEALGHVTFPAVVRPARSRVFDGRRWRNTSVRYAASADELRRVYEGDESLLRFPSLVQERIVGPGVGLFVLLDRGTLVAAFAHRRLREKPASGGVSVLCESVPVDPRLLGGAMRLLGALRWHGVAMFEYKRDLHTGEHFLIEVNGRFWGSLQLAVDAGVDFPYLSFLLAQGARPDPPPPYRVGVRNRWLLGDLDHLLGRLLKRARVQDLAPDAPSRWRVVRDFLASTRPEVKDQVASASDPAPFLHELRHYAAGLAASVAR
jgi:predicted ATP-grasp superfamily ATP-dependent carboligase